MIKMKALKKILLAITNLLRSFAGMKKLDGPGGNPPGPGNPKTPGG